MGTVAASLSKTISLTSSMHSTAQKITVELALDSSSSRSSSQLATVFKEVSIRKACLESFIRLDATLSSRKINDFY